MATTTTPSTLCAACEKFKFEWLLPKDQISPSIKHVRQPDGTPQETSTRARHIRLGHLKEIVSRSETCSLCNFLSTIYETESQRKAFSSSPHVINQNHRNVYIWIYSQIIGSVRNNDFERTRIASWYIRGLSMFSRDENRENLWFLDALLLPSLPWKIASEPTLLARYRPALCDVSLFRSWLHTCEKSHPGCSNTTNKRTHILRLIDVEEMCLVTLNENEKLGTRYLALSYVWGGGTKDFVLTRANIHDFCQPHGLPPLPKTISEAILLTSQMQERYLWVDSLCIISDDPQDKAIQIPAMTSIYGCAMLTVIAASGQNAEKGLSGLCIPRSEVKAVDLGHYHLVRSHYTYKENPISDTKWASRGWTYQELLLSPRSLIFLEEQVVWTCRCDRWVEELDFDHPDAGFRWGDEPDRGGGEVTTSLTIDNYWRLVRDYTKRELTFEDDIVDAFRGIMEAIPGEFFWGIPAWNFGTRLLWHHRDHSSTPVEASVRRFCALKIPSWSWFAWKGCVELGTGNGCVLTIYRWKHEKLQILYYANRLLWPEVFESIWGDSSGWLVELNDIPESVVLNENQLIFWAFVLEADGIHQIHDQVVVELMIPPSVDTWVISWHNGVARREGNGCFSESRMKDAVKKLIVME
jgi:hypothetical protein